MSEVMKSHYLVKCSLGLTLLIAILLPFSILAEDRWEQIGQTFEDSAEDAGIYSSNDIEGSSESKRKLIGIM